ncbi:carbamate kinase [Candidatus Izemoplasma sp. B36]|uniref:carbamate kinase n=1 Tax=Candidatus Izemoplasma sp. B36 TaxID=3242468 RepID=UPI003556EF71
MKTIVVALGGNALGKTPEEQIKKVKHAVKPIVDLVKAGNEVILAHGNGPQVGMINLSFETSNHVAKSNPAMPFPECGAMSQGYIGYHLQNALLTELKNQHMDQKVATVVTQVEVSEKDTAFQNPTKPIGSFYDKETAIQLEETKGYDMVEDAGRGYRRVVPSPKPVNVVEIDIIRTLVDAGHLVITVGGGGIPVIKRGNEFIGVPAVIDKDFASSKLADLLDADMLIILTAVNKVKINFNKENELSLNEVTTKELDKYIEEGHFLKGSMLPKIEASKAFVNGKNGRIAIIAALEEAGEAIKGNAGTKITN